MVHQHHQTIEEHPTMSTVSRAICMAQKRVLLIESGQFIGGVIRNLFLKYDDLTVFETSPNNTRELNKAVKRYQPDIIVLDDTVNASFLSLLLRLLQNRDDLRVVVVNTDNNHVSVYQKQKIEVSQTDDFFSIL